MFRNQCAEGSIEIILCFEVVRFYINVHLLSREFDMDVVVRDVSAARRLQPRCWSDVHTTFSVRSYLLGAACRIFV